MKYLTFDAILDNADDEQEAIDYARGFVSSECELTSQSIAYGRYIDTVDGVEVYYDYGADYYFYCPTADHLADLMENHEIEWADTL